MDINKHIQNLSQLEDSNDNFLHVTAYENRMSNTARSFMNSHLADRYYFGAGDERRVINWDPFTTLGLPAVEAILADAEDAVKQMIGGEIVNLRCLSGVHAMMCAILVATKPGDTVMIVHHDDGGHFSTRPILEKSGRKVVYAVFDATTMTFDSERTAQIFRQQNCSAFYLDISYPLRPVNLMDIRQAIGEEPTIIFDASHTMGLIMGGLFQNPFKDGADIICANTHKTLPGPHKGMIVFKDRERFQELDDQINHGLFSTSHTHHLIALAVTILEMKKYGKEYVRQIVANSNALGRELTEAGREVRMINGVYSYTHQLHLFLPTDREASGIYADLISNRISTNFDDRMGGRVFARLGTQELTRRGMKEKEMSEIADILHHALNGADVSRRVDEINRKFPKIMYSFDEELGN